MQRVCLALVIGGTAQRPGQAQWGPIRLHRGGWGAAWPQFSPVGGKGSAQPQSGCAGGGGLAIWAGEGGSLMAVALLPPNFPTHGESRSSLP